MTNILIVFKSGNFVCRNFEKLVPSVKFDQYKKTTSNDTPSTSLVDGQKSKSKMSYHFLKSNGRPHRRLQRDRVYL